MNGELIFRIFVNISSYPYEFYILSDFMIFSISFIIVQLHFVIGYGSYKVGSIKWVWLSILLLWSLQIITLFLPRHLIFSMVATKYSLKVSTIICWSVNFWPSTFRVHSSLFFFISSWFFIYNMPCSFNFIIGVYN